MTRVKRLGDDGASRKEESLSTLSVRPFVEKDEEVVATLWREVFAGEEAHLAGITGLSRRGDGVPRPYGRRADECW